MKSPFLHSLKYIFIIDDIDDDLELEYVDSFAAEKRYYRKLHFSVRNRTETLFEYY